MRRHTGGLPVGITPYYVSLLDPTTRRSRCAGPSCRCWAEFVRTPGEADDPLGEDGHSPVPGLVHRYPDRVLFLVADFCSTYCRYCTRSRVVGPRASSASKKRGYEAALDYIAATPDIRDVLISGGDPLAMDDDRLDWCSSACARSRTSSSSASARKMPAVLPQRITPSCADAEALPSRSG